MKEEDFQFFIEKGYAVPRQTLSPTQEYKAWVHEGVVYKPEFHGMKETGKEPKLFVVFGAIIYGDVFGTWWVTKFCYKYDGMNRFLPFTNYNGETKHKSERKALESLWYVEPQHRGATPPTFPPPSPQPPA